MNPFIDRKTCSSDTFLLNFGEEDLTLFRSLSKKQFIDRGRGDVQVELNILDKVRREAYKHRKNK